MMSLGSVVRQVRLWIAYEGFQYRSVVLSIALARCAEPSFDFVQAHSDQCRVEDVVDTNSFDWMLIGTA